MSYDTRLQRRVDWFVWASALAFGVFAMHGVHGATPDAAAPKAPVPKAAAPRATAPTAEAVHRQECGDCHLAYAPRFLPAATWRQVMTGLDRHFGVDASLDPATAAVIAGWLVQGAAAPGRSSREESDDEDEAGRGGEAKRASRAAPGPSSPATALTPTRSGAGGVRVDDASLRVTTTPWFVREHREVPAATWRRAAIGSAANCAACHTDAARGRFSERALRIPN